MNPEQLKQAIEGALFAAGKPLSVDQLSQLFAEESADKQAICQAVEQLQAECESRGVELVEVGSGFRFQVKSGLALWVSRLWEEKPPRYSRAVLETLALIAYRQPITRGEIEEIRGVSVSSHIIKTLSEREWIRIVGHRDVPGRPALFGTTNGFLDYFNLKSLAELPTLAEIRSIDSIERELDFGETLGGQPQAVEADPASASDDDDVEASATVDSPTETAEASPPADEHADSDAVASNP